MTRHRPEGLGEMGRLTLHALFLAVLALLFSSQPQAVAGEWPQILGPTRNGHAAADERLAETWPASGPKGLWQYNVGEGYAGPAVASGKCILFHRQGGELLVEALDAATGKPLWKHRQGTSYVSSIDRDAGPRASPVVHDGHVYLHGPEGELFCLALDTGKPRWSRSLADDFGLPNSYFGAGSTPLVEGDKLLVNVGARGGAGIVAVRLADGETAWKATDEGASYSSPVAATVAGVRHAIFVTRLNVVSLDPATGKVRFRFAFGQRGPTVNAATPLICDGNVFVTASYGIGAVLAAIGEKEARPVWKSADSISSQYATSLYVDGVLYGSDGRADQPPVHLKAVDAKTGRVLWTEKDFGVAHLIHAGGRAIAVKETGALVLWKPSPKKFEQLAATTDGGGTTRALPALAEGRLYVRDEKTLRCYQVGEKR